MRSQAESSRVTVLFGLPAIMLISAILLRTLPHHVLTVLMAWTLASVPIGILIGHCALGEE